MAKSIEKIQQQAAQWYEQKTGIKGDLPDGFLHDLTFGMLGHGYLEDCGNPDFWEMEECEVRQPLSWLRFERLPTHPSRMIISTCWSADKACSAAPTPCI